VHSTTCTARHAQAARAQAARAQAARAQVARAQAARAGCGHQVSLKGPERAEIGKPWHDCTVTVEPLHTDVLVVGAGPAGSAAAAWCARAGMDVLLADAEHFPRDKACGDGLTPRAILALRELGMSDYLNTCAVNVGLRAAGFGQTLLLPWPGGKWPTTGGASPRMRLDNAIHEVALAAGARELPGARAIDVTMNGDHIAAVTFRTEEGLREVRAQRVIVADGAKSTLGRVLGRQWHRDTVYGVASRAYISSDRHDDPWISSHLELRDADGVLLSGYGWVFPLADGGVNIGVGTLATDKRPANINLRTLLDTYVGQQRDDWKLQGDISNYASRPLPMGGAVSNIAGRNWVMIGDAAACINPLNGEGIDYGLETGRLAAIALAEHSNLSRVWPQILHKEYGAAFSIARRLGDVLTLPGFLIKAGPIGMRSRWMMEIALRLMGNLVSDEDTDTIARLWRTAGSWSSRMDERAPFGVK